MGRGVKKLVGESDVLKYNAGKRRKSESLEVSLPGIFLYLRLLYVSLSAFWKTQTYFNCQLFLTNIYQKNVIFLPFLKFLSL